MDPFNTTARHKLLKIDNNSDNNKRGQMILMFYFIFTLTFVKYTDKKKYRIG